MPVVVRAGTGIAAGRRAVVKERGKCSSAGALRRVVAGKSSWAWDAGHGVAMLRSHYFFTTSPNYTRLRYERERERQRQRRSEAVHLVPDDRT